LRVLLNTVVSLELLLAEEKQNSFAFTSKWEKYTKTTQVNNKSVEIEKEAHHAWIIGLPKE